jgi:hypothetical protein
MSRFTAFAIIMFLIVWIPILCSDAYISYLAKQYFSGDSYGSNLEFGFVISMCIIIFLKFVNSVYTIREIIFKEGVIRVTYVTRGIILLVVAISIVSTIVCDGRYLIFTGIPRTIACFTFMVSAGIIVVLIIILIFTTFLIAIQNMNSGSLKESISRNFKSLFKRDVAKIYAVGPENVV